RHIERAVSLARQDPDVYYCRAEIAVRTDLPLAIRDVRHYLEMVEALHEKDGVPLNRQKHARVRAMLQHLERVAAGKEPLGDTMAMWDPIEHHGHGGPSLAPFAAATVLGLAAAVALIVRAR